MVTGKIKNVSNLLMSKIESYKLLLIHYLMGTKIFTNLIYMKIIFERPFPTNRNSRTFFQIIMTNSKFN